MQLNRSRSLKIVVADDDLDDREMMLEAMTKSKFLIEPNFVEDGEQLMKYLKREGEYSDNIKFPSPGIILLDLNMPKKDGRQALQEIKSNEELKRIPVVVLSTSQSENEILKLYNLGANSFITKPITFEGLQKLIELLGQYWFELAVLPPKYSLP